MVGRKRPFSSEIPEYYTGRPHGMQEGTGLKSAASGEKKPSGQAGTDAVSSPAWNMAGGPFPEPRISLMQIAGLHRMQSPDGTGDPFCPQEVTA